MTKVRPDPPFEFPFDVMSENPTSEESGKIFNLLRNAINNQPSDE